MSISLFTLDWRPGERKLRGFGMTCVLVCVVLGALALWRGSILGLSLTSGTAREVGYVLFAIAAISAALAWMAPRVLLPLYVVLTAISLPIGFVVSYLVLAMLFYLVLTPFGLVFRLLGRDALMRHFDKSADSYWVRRTPVNSITRYYHQY